VGQFLRWKTVVLQIGSGRELTNYKSPSPVHISFQFFQSDARGQIYAVGSRSHSKTCIETRTHIRSIVSKICMHHIAVSTPEANSVDAAGHRATMGICATLNISFLRLSRRLCSLRVYPEYRITYSFVTFGSRFLHLVFVKKL